MWIQQLHFHQICHRPDTLSSWSLCSTSVGFSFLRGNYLHQKLEIGGDRSYVGKESIIATQQLKTHGGCNMALLLSQGPGDN